MRRTVGRIHDTFDSGIRGAKNLFHLRMVELFAFFAIVIIARQIADFHYRSDLFLALFVLAVFLQFNGHGLWKSIASFVRTPPNVAHNGLLWYSSVLDFCAVVAIIYLTGTIESPFLFLLVVPLFFVSHLFTWRVSLFGFVNGSITAIAVLGYLELIGVLPHFTCYEFGNDVYLDKHYYVGTLLVLGGFLSLILFLSNAFQDHFHHSLDTLRRKDKATADKIYELSRLYDISLGINAVMTVETLLKMVAKEATLLLSQPWAGIVLFNQDQEVTHTVVVGIPDGLESKFGSKIEEGTATEWLWKRNKPLVIGETREDRRTKNWEFLSTAGIRSLIGLPLSTGQHVIGAMYVGDFQPKEFEERQLRLLAIMCDQLAIAIAKSKLYESIQRKIHTYEKQLEGLVKADQLKSEFVSHVSHELRTPLTSIKAYLETLVHHIDDPTFKEKKEFLGIVSKETERLIRIVNDILDVSNIEFGQRPIQRSSFELDAIIYEVTSMLQPKLKDKNITVETVIPENLPKVDGDKDLMTQVLINLVTNAVKYSPEKTTIRIEVEEEPVDLKISIEDQGIGIPEGQIERIFEKYFRVKSEKSRQYDGVGLGLAIVKNIIEQHGGAISVFSEENVGTKFTFTIPKEHCVNDLIGYITEGVSAKTEMHEMMTLIVRMIAELLSAKIVSLMLLDQNRSELFIKVSYGLDEWIVDQARVKVGEGIAGKVAETGMPLLIDNIEKNEIYISPNNPQYETMSLLSVPLRVNNIIVGVVNVNNKTSGEPFNQDDMNLLLSFAERISKSLERLRTAGASQAYLQDTVEAYRKMLYNQVQTRAIEKIVDQAVKVSRKLGLSEREVKVIQYVASIHDIGMTKVSDEILNKTFDLSPEEIKEIQSHPQKGADLIRPMEFMEAVSQIILYHHERVDGLGYPMGLKGDQIPVGSRILAIIDAFQSMTTEKPYRPELSMERALKELVDCSGKQFDGSIVECFLEVLGDEGKVSSKQIKELKKSLRGVMQSTY